MASIKITLPWPPSVNTYWRSFRGRNILSEKARSYKKTAHAAILSNGWKVTGPVSVSIQLHPKDKRRRDADNTLKPLLDSLVSAGAIEDDDYRTVREISVRWGDMDKQNPRAEITITEQVE